MSIYFLDSSTLVKRYVTEVGSTWIHALIRPAVGNSLIIARITWVEVLSALARRQREDNLSPEDVQQAIQTFRYDLDMQYQVVELDSSVAEAAGALVARHPLRAYDAVQLASALRVQTELDRVYASPLMFLVADSRLATIAQAEGLHTDNPNDHP
ncbi:MAG: type II toxin-antitoxin system VapC family toxin [Anaerolineae bacterium]|nr:type II toxin-antitoxin system VapC family toxin [Anaerolineae bacterium]